MSYRHDSVDYRDTEIRRENNRAFNFQSNQKWIRSSNCHRVDPKYSSMWRMRSAFDK